MMPLKNVPRFFHKAVSQPGYACRVLFKRLQAYWSYSFGRGKSPMPESVTLFLTHACNLRCRMCGQWGEAGVTRTNAGALLQEKHLTLSDAIGFVNQLTTFSPSITLFGGEPFLFKGCTDLIRHIKSKRMHCLVITNGSMLGQVARDIVEAGLDELNISLDAGRILHDQIRGMDGLFDRIMSGIDAVNRYKKELGRNKPFINLQTTITQYNYRHLQDMLDVARQAQARSLTFHQLIFLSRQVIEEQKAVDAQLGCASRGWEGFVLEPGIEVEELIGVRKRILARQHSFNIDFYPNFPDEQLRRYYVDPQYRPQRENSRCISPWLVAYVFPDGEVRPCLNSDYSFGSLADMPFQRVWNSPKAVTFRQLLAAKKIFPACIRCTELYRY